MPAGLQLGTPILPPRAGWLFLDRSKFAGSFAADLPAADAPSSPTRRSRGTSPPSAAS
nr:hypothetical protein [Micromonospora eburnea]